MELTFVNDFGQSFVVEIDPNMELENVMALLEAEVSGHFTDCSDKRNDTTNKWAAIVQYTST